MDYAEAQRNPGKHSIGFGIVIVLHVLLGYALVSGLARRVVEVAMKPVETKIIEEVKPPPPPPPENLPPPPKNLPPPPAFVPPPEVNINPPPNPQPSISAQNQVPPPAPPANIQAPATPPPPAQPRGVVARPAQLNVANCEKPEYPAKARSQEVSGSTHIRFTVDETGHVTKAEIVKPSGSSREHRMLDKAAVDALSICPFKPGVDDSGKPVGGQTTVIYDWKLE